MTEPDDLRAVLGPRPPGTGEERVRQEVLRNTTRRVRRRLLARRVRAVLAGVVVFGVGGAVGWALKPAPGLDSSHQTIVQSPSPSPRPSPSPSPSPPPLELAEVELRAEQAVDPAEAARLYRLAGDRYLTDRSDFAQAARCYRLHLFAAGPEGRAVRGDDSWLLISLKTADSSEGGP
jgi:hypothetical protein